MRELQHLVAHKTPQGVLVRGHAGLVINKLSLRFLQRRGHVTPFPRPARSRAGAGLALLVLLNHSLGGGEYMVALSTPHLHAVGLRLTCQNSLLDAAIGCEKAGGGKLYQKYRRCDISAMQKTGSTSLVYTCGITVLHGVRMSSCNCANYVTSIRSGEEGILSMFNQPAR